MNLRMIGLGAAVVCATLLPLGALAGPAAGPGPSDDAKAADAAHEGGGADGGLLWGTGLGVGGPVPASASPSSPAPAQPPARASRCGPELTSPDGIEAQTCVMAEGPDIWGRTYYRNATGRELESILTLMGPGGRTVQVRCSITAQDEPGACETPKERGRGAASAYSAVAEFAGAGEGGSAPLLLRSGSNPAGSTGS
ncbi:hypothetical protein [Streptomyces sp. NPDC093600]|uniref:hypothetical protein n=1 Tax=Streptomyces sp. NPDC093600 TaxID=3366047 RepID=UPI00380D6005